MSADTNPGIYPGNLSLPKEVRDKILSTFRHALNLFGEGKIDDCLIGCDFILKMDPRFGPARKLMEKARNPNAEIDIATLEAIVATTPSRQERVVAADTDRLLVRAVESYNARDFDAAIAAAEQVLGVLPGNQDALEIIEKAAEKKSVQPLFDASRQRALAALDAHRPEDARRELEHMRGLDAEHPAVPLLERRIGPAPKAPAKPPEPSGLHGHFGGETREPEIAFDAGATVSIDLDAAPPPPPQPPPKETGAAELDALSLDSLSLDLPVPGGPPPRSDSPAPAAAATRAGSPQPASPAPPPPPIAQTPEPESGENDAATLLKQGDDAAERGDRQQAIEIWSRIFLIDINNSDAVARIEKARQDMAEGNRAVSDGLKAGREKFEAGDLSGARELFNKVLSVDENEATARFYLDRIEEQLAHPKPAPAAAAAGAAGQVPAAAAAAAAAPVRAIRLPVNTKVLGLMGAFVGLTLVGVYYFVFRGPKPQPRAVRGTASGGELERARKLVAGAKIAEARAELSRVPAASPDYAEAQKMLAQLGASGAGEPAAGAPSESLPGSPAGGASAGAAAPSRDPAVFRANAQKAFAEKRYIEALKNFNLAAPAYRDDPTFGQAMGVAAEKVSALTPAVKLYNEGEYDTAIPILWRITQDERDNQDARSYLLRAYFNQGITQLQNGLIEKAIQSFDEALAIDATDADAIRNKKFSERYRKGDLDLMGRIYVRHLSHRP